jgi:hypothetical protein
VYLHILLPGDAGEETELLTWLLYQMKEDTIENINRDLLNKMIDDFEFLAVFFCKHLPVQQKNTAA